jgi:hypothetical protein|tara:strand:- start:3119 stop:3331 length:213 start_codon:yes stop_codon:yes gene_type:complete
MGPFSEARQIQRADAIGRLLRDNPDIDPLYRAIWERHLKNLAYNETSYNERVKHVYSLLKPRHRGWTVYE